MHELNHATMKEHGVSRYERFQQEKHLLLPLPRDSFCIPEYRTAKVHPDCHIQFKRNFYSVPHELASSLVKVRATQKVIEIFDHEGNAAATHILKEGKGKWSTHDQHYPQKAIALQSYTVQKAFETASRIGAETLKLIQFLCDGDYPYQHIRRVQGILNFHKAHSKTGKRTFNTQEMEHAASMCLRYQKYTYAYFKGCASQHQISQQNATTDQSPKRNRESIHLDESSSTNFLN